MPWNPAIWWSMRRLRLAVEVDCDRRLIVAGVDPHEYASLLLAVGERISATPFAWATALAGSRSSLETRILAMTSSLRPRHTKLAIVGVCTIAAALIAIACASPVPDPVVPPPAGTVVPVKFDKVTRDSMVDLMVRNPGTAGHAMFTKAMFDSITRDSAMRAAADTNHHYRRAPLTEVEERQLENRLVNQLRRAWVAAKAHAAASPSDSVRVLRP
jgi:hypothetical protein